MSNVILDLKELGITTFAKTKIALMEPLGDPSNFNMPPDYIKIPEGTIVGLIDGKGAIAKFGYTPKLKVYVQNGNSYRFVKIHYRNLTVIG